MLLSDKSVCKRVYGDNPPGDNPPAKNWSSAYLRDYALLLSTLSGATLTAQSGIQTNDAK